MLRSPTFPVFLVLVGVALLVVGLVQNQPALESTSPDQASLPVASTRDNAPATAAPTLRPTRFATRVVIQALAIDLPVIAQPGGPDSYPPCDVAMYLEALSSPGFPGATYIYAHARHGMFLPILEASTVNDGKSLLGLVVGVYTTDNLFFTYRVSQVHRHVVSLGPALAVRDEQLWLQTSEGPHGTVGKLELVADPVSWRHADVSESHPTPHALNCA